MYPAEWPWSCLAPHSPITKWCAWQADPSYWVWRFRYGLCLPSFSLLLSKLLYIIHIGGHRHQSQCRRYPTSDIDICYSDIGDKYVILISEVFRYRHQSSFRYPTLKKKEKFTLRFEPAPLGMMSEHFNFTLLGLSYKIGMLDIGYRIKLHSDIRYNVGLRSLSPISEVPISGSVRYRWSRISD